MKSIEEFNQKLKSKMKKDKRHIMTVQSQLGSSFENFLKSKPKYESFEDFLADIKFPLKQSKK